MADLEQLFSVASQLALAGWLTLAVLPFWRGAQVIAGVIVPVVLALGYATLLGSGMLSTLGGAPATEGGFGSLADVRELFADDRVLLAGWVHYLAFDLFIGAWEVRDSRRHRVPHLIVLPCLALTFMFGPVGLLVYLLARTIRTRGLPDLS